MANYNKLKAFLRVGKETAFGLDLTASLPAAARTGETVSDANTKMALPNDQLHYAQFWFMKSTPLDNVAMNHLATGNAGMALSIWEKKEDASSLQNWIASTLIQGDYPAALACAERLYSAYTADFVNLVLGKGNTADGRQLAYRFLDELCSAAGAKAILPCIQNNDWKQYVSSKAVKPLIDTLESAIDAAKATKRKNITVRYKAGIKQMADTEGALI